MRADVNSNAAPHIVPLASFGVTDGVDQSSYKAMGRSRLVDFDNCRAYTDPSQPHAGLIA